MAPFPTTLTTDRLVATRTDLATELDDYAALFADPAVAGPMWPAHLGGVRTREQSEQFLAHFDAHWNAHGFGPWTVRERDGGAFVGQVGLGHTIVAGRAEVEAGFILAHDRWGRGYATEVTRAALQHAPSLRGLASVVAFATRDNARALATLERCGFAHEADAVMFELDVTILRVAV
ncbi:GNAT family N-acetyltransferase [Conexibacter stalactiti]|uniref:GNAT family N-acetyltransferase n=1 Tax=Conexibacter stalactiti TaxID=1940611 RepID=A0ABU4HX74_9ACTN|nr:GNAT family N-acetyltransferase [Conexibacter stalactiti]MDW5597927.1 GNAT family N-acetyltransferase [Conexibacter stalactiti]MEC5038569.1 GNAT family N-acetyltransferase [Conexibacter stalactiti]